ncbi:hypothetical protein C8R46DRAFT_1214422 [Mycena filopes]|nr:hypothetical protein C8R46DRAFT_1214422 [Mycena filopes]
MDDSDASWCAVCDRQIIPKRIQVPIQPPTPNPPPSPQHDSPRRAKQGTIRQRSGLVHGTGRVRPNGTIKAAPVKTRTEIDQSPAPLYCSDECRHKDDEYFHARPVYPTSDTSDDQDDSNIRPIPRHNIDPPRRSTPNTRALAYLQREMGMPPLPPPTSETYDELAPKKHRAVYRPPAYTSGVMMAHRRIDAVLPKALKPGERPPPLQPIPGWTDGSQAWRASTYSFAPPPQTRADVLDPNRAAYESFVASPHRSAQSGVTASSSSAPYGYGSGGSPPTSPTTTGTPSSLNSELLSSFEDSLARRTSSRLSLFPSPASSVAASSPPSHTATASASSSPPRKNRAQMAAKGMLLVPDVLLRQPVRSSDSLVSMSLKPTMTADRAGRRHSAGSFPGCSTGPGRRMRSPLSVSSSTSDDDERDASGSGGTESEDAEEAAYVRECGEAEAAPLRRRPNIESAFLVSSLCLRPMLTSSCVVAARSWSYDNVRTYPAMAQPVSLRKELRSVVGADGVARQVEVEVEVPPQKLFTFAQVPR